MKLQLDQIARKMKDLGFSSKNAYDEDFINRIIEMLDNRELFTLIGEEMQIIEDEESENKKMNYEDYVGRFGQEG